MTLLNLYMNLYRRLRAMKHADARCEALARVNAALLEDLRAAIDDRDRHAALLRALRGELVGASAGERLYLLTTGEVVPFAAMPVSESIQ